MRVLGYTSENQHDKRWPRTFFDYIFFWILSRSYMYTEYYPVPALAVSQCLINHANQGRFRNCAQRIFARRIVIGRGNSASTRGKYECDFADLQGRAVRCLLLFSSTYTRKRWFLPPITLRYFMCKNYEINAITISYSFIRWSIGF